MRPLYSEEPPRSHLIRGLLVMVALRTPIQILLRLRALMKGQLMPHSTRISGSVPTFRKPITLETSLRSASHRALACTLLDNKPSIGMESNSRLPFRSRNPRSSSCRRWEMALKANLLKMIVLLSLLIGSTRDP